MKPTLVIIEDCRRVRERLSSDLAKDFRLLATGKDGEGALGLVEEHQPDLLLMDICLPQVSGLQALKRLGQLRKCPKTVLLSAVRHPLWLDLAFQWGASDYLLKPASVDHLCEALQRAYAR